MATKQELAVQAQPEERPVYGAPELKRLYQRYFATAFAVAVLVHALVLGGYFLAQALQKEEEPVMTVRILKYSELGPPPSITNTEAAPQMGVSGPVVKPSVGVPVPVPDAEVSAEQTFASQKELSQVQAPVASMTGGNEQVVIQEAPPPEDAPPPDFVPYEKEPTPVRTLKPEYPELARRAGLEGTVLVKIWVNKEGKPKKALVVKSDAEIFNQPSTDAAMKFVFTPALMNNGPVAVWVIIPFRFTLKK